MTTAWCRHLGKIAVDTRLKLAAVGLLVIECEQPRRSSAAGKASPGPIDAHLAVLTALRLETDRLAVPRADGVREPLAGPAGGTGPAAGPRATE
jgi:hypothetical protein